MYPKYATKIESSVKDFVQAESNPHDIGKSIVSLDNKKKLSPVQKERHRQKNRIDNALTNDEKSFLTYDLERCYNKFREFGVSPCAALNQESQRITAEEHGNMTLDPNISLSEYCKLDLTTIAEQMCKEVE